MVLIFFFQSVASNSTTSQGFSNAEINHKNILFTSNFYNICKPVGEDGISFTFPFFYSNLNRKLFDSNYGRHIKLSDARSFPAELNETFIEKYSRASFYPIYQTQVFKSYFSVKYNIEGLSSRILAAPAFESCFYIIIRIL